MRFSSPLKQVVGPKPLGGKHRTKLITSWEPHIHAYTPIHSPFTLSGQYNPKPLDLIGNPLKGPFRKPAFVPALANSPASIPFTASAMGYGSIRLAWCFRWIWPVLRVLGPSSKGRLLLSYGSPSSGCRIVLVFIIDVPERSLVIGQS